MSMSIGMRNRHNLGFAEIGRPKIKEAITKRVAKYTNLIAATVALSGVSGIASAVSPTFSFYSTLIDTSSSTPSFTPQASTLITVDPTTGAQTQVGAAGGATGVNYLTRDPVSGLLYGSEAISSSGEGIDNSLFVISPITGVTVGSVAITQSAAPSTVDPIAFSPHGMLYGVNYQNDNTFSRGANTLGTINPVTGAFSAIHAVAIPSIVGATGFVESITFAPQGTLYAILDYSNNAQVLGTVDSVTGTFTTISNSAGGSYAIGATDYASDGSIYTTNFSYQLLKMDATTGTTVDVGSGSLGALGGLTEVPEPSSIAFLSLGTAGMMARRRRLIL